MITTLVIMQIPAARHVRTAGPRADIRSKPIIRPITRNAFDFGIPHTRTANNPLSHHRPQIAVSFECTAGTGFRYTRHPAQPLLSPPPRSPRRRIGPFSFDHAGIRLHAPRGSKDFVSKDTFRRALNLNPRSLRWCTSPD